MKNISNQSNLRQFTFFIINAIYSLARFRSDLIESWLWWTTSCMTHKKLENSQKPLTLNNLTLKSWTFIWKFISNFRLIAAKLQQYYCKIFRRDPFFIQFKINLHLVTREVGAQNATFPRDFGITITPPPHTHTQEKKRKWKDLFRFLILPCFEFVRNIV